MRQKSEAIPKLKLTLIGSEKSGKSQLLNRFKGNEYEKSYQSTIGAAFESISRSIKRITVNLQLWDTAGAERFRPQTPMYTRGAAAIGIVLTPGNLSDIDTFYPLAVKNSGSSVPPIYIIINKMDLADDPEGQTAAFGEEEAAKLIWKEEALRTEIKDRLETSGYTIDNENILFCSAKTNTGVDEAFQAMTEGAYNYKDQLSKPKKTVSFSEPLHTVLPSLNKKKPSLTTIEKVWAAGDVVLIIGIIATLVTLATLPIGGALVLGPLTALALAGIICAAAFVLWNVGCALANWVENRRTSYQPLLSNADANITNRASLLNEPTSTQNTTPNPQQYVSPLPKVETNTPDSSVPTEGFRGIDLTQKPEVNDPKQNNNF